MTIDAARAGLRAWRRSSSTSSTARPAATLAGFLHRGRQLADFLRVYLRAARRLAPVGSRAVILAIDQGTTGHHLSACSTSRRGCVGRAYREFTQHFPRPGWVEHDADEIWEVSRAVAHEALDAAGIARRAVSARSASPTSARRSWPGTSAPASRCTTRSCGRTAAPPRAATSCARRGCEDARARAHRPRDRPLLLRARRSSGCCENVEGLRERAAAGGVRFGTIDAWLAFKLTGRAVTDYSNASRTMLFDIHTLRWDDELCDALGVPPAALPEPVALGAGARRDRSRRLPRGRACRSPAWPATSRRRCSARPALEPGLGKNTYGTGSFVLQNAGAAARRRCAPGLLTTVAWGIERPRRLRARGERVRDRRGGPVAARRARDHLASRPRPRPWRASLDSNDGVYFVPALTGLGSPHWDPYARGTIVGLTRGTRREHLARAALEAIAYQTVDAVEAMEAASGQAARRAARGRRRGRERLADAVPGRRAGPPGGGARRCRRPPRSAPPTWPASASGMWTLERRALDLARGGALRAPHGRRRARVAAARVAAGASSGRRRTGLG